MIPSHGLGLVKGEVVISIASGRIGVTRKEENDEIECGVDMDLLVACKGNEQSGDGVVKFLIHFINLKKRHHAV